MTDDRTSAGRGLRLVRAAALALVSLVSGIVGHVSAGGTPPAPGSLLLLTAALTLMTATVLGRPASPALILVLLVAGQVFLHVSFGLLPPMRDHTPAMPGHGAGMPGMTGMAETADASVDPAMLAAHAGAVVVVALWLALGERTLWALLLLVTRPVLRLLASWDRAPVDVRVPARPSPAYAARLPAPRLLAHRPTWHRGPPAALWQVDPSAPHGVLA